MMKWSIGYGRVLLAALAALLSLAVFLAPSSAFAAAEGTLTVAAASSLTFPLKEIAAAFEKETGVRVVISFGSTGNLTAQIENGAPFDILLAADTAHARRLVEGGRGVPDTEAVYAEGRIVLVVNRASGLEIKRFEDLLDPGIRRVAMANPDHAPYGAAAKEALLKLGLWEKVRGKVVYGESVRQALRYVQTGDAEAGIVALSVAGVPEVGQAAIDPALYPPIRQSAVVVRGGDVELAKRFLEYLLGPAGRYSLERHGFAPPEGRR